MNITGARGKSWYVRLVIYLIVLLAVAYIISASRGRIPQAFGLTPIRVHAESVRTVPVRDERQVAMNDVSVQVRVVGWDSVFTDLRLNQFRLRTSGSENHQPYASTFLFDSTGTITICRNDTLRGTLMFLVPEGETPEELWWEP